VATRLSSPKSCRGETNQSGDPRGYGPLVAGRGLMSRPRRGGREPRRTSPPLALTKRLIKKLLWTAIEFLKHGKKEMDLST
jgi:hypothetical protein